MLIALAGASPAAAATFAVDDLGDTVDANAGDGRCQTAAGTCTLRAAVMEANEDRALDPATDRIVLPEGTIRLTIPPAPAVSTFDPDDDRGNLHLRFGAYELVGQGADRTIVEQTQADRVLSLLVATVKISNLTLRGGRAPNFYVPRDRAVGNNGCGGGIHSLSSHVQLQGVRVTENEAFVFGGGICTDRYSSLALEHSTVSANRASMAGGIGGVGVVELFYSLVQGNTVTPSRATAGAAGGGGGIWMGRKDTAGFYDSTLRLYGSTVAENRVAALGPETGSRPGEGGGILSLAAEVHLTDSTIRDNSAVGRGGGIAHRDGHHKLKVTGSTISGNRALQGGGAFVDNWSEFENSTISGNAAEGLGGGIAFQSSLRAPAFGFAGRYNRAVLRNVTLAENTTASLGAPAGVWRPGREFRLTFARSILGDAAARNCNDGMLDGGYNLETGTSCELTAATSRSSVAPQLGGLADNGGPTRTHAPIAGSPAIDAVPRCEGSARDQRFAPRPFGASCDIGAVEAGSTPEARLFLTPSLLSVILEAGVLDFIVSRGMRRTMSAEGVRLETPDGGKSSRGSAKLDGAGYLNSGHMAFTPYETLAFRHGRRRATLLDQQVVTHRGRGRVFARFSQEGPLLRVMELRRVRERKAGGRVRVSARVALTSRGAREINRRLGARVFGRGEVLAFVRVAGRLLAPGPFAPAPSPSLPQAEPLPPSPPEPSPEPPPPPTPESPNTPPGKSPNS